MVNEEGLPIVEINEPLSGTAESSSLSAYIVEDEPDIPPLWALSDSEKERRRADRDSILDMLEEEEKLEKERGEATERERFKSELEKKKETAMAELESLRKARELQKKMGKALFKNAKDIEERGPDVKASTETEESAPTDNGRTDAKRGKSVSFADASDKDKEASSSVDWGDVAPGRLDAKRRTSLLTQAQMDQQPMKMQVVERQPGATHAPIPPSPRALQRDSDDESDIESDIEDDSDTGEMIDDRSSLSIHDPMERSDEEQSDEDEAAVEWGDEQFDYAQHQREVALAYYEKRATIGAVALSAMRAHSHTEDEWNQPVCFHLTSDVNLLLNVLQDVPLEATLASAPPKPAVSRFKAEHFGSHSRSGSSTLASHSLGASILPSESSSSLRRAVRMGSLEDDQLVGGDAGDSADEMDDAAREVFEMLKRGEIKNIGPQQPHLTTQSAIPSNDPAQLTSSTSEAAVPTRSPKPSRVSKFKMNLSRPINPPSNPSSSSLDTPLTLVERSSPKLVAPAPATVVPIPSSASRPQSNPIRAHQDSPHQVPQASTSKPVTQMPSMVVDSPSFPAPSRSNAAQVQMPGMIVDSPSFAPPPTANNTGPPSKSQSLAQSGHGVPIIASEVKESDTGAKGDASSTGNEPPKEKKISRFKMERM